MGAGTRRSPSVPAVDLGFGVVTADGNQCWARLGITAPSPSGHPTPSAREIHSSQYARVGWIAMNEVPDPTSPPTTTNSGSRGHPTTLVDLVRGMTHTRSRRHDHLRGRDRPGRAARHAARCGLGTPSILVKTTTSRPSGGRSGLGGGGDVMSAYRPRPHCGPPDTGRGREPATVSGSLTPQPLPYEPNPDPPPDDPKKAPLFLSTLKPQMIGVGSIVLSRVCYERLADGLRWRHPRSLRWVDRAATSHGQRPGGKKSERADGGQAVMYQKNGGRSAIRRVANGRLLTPGDHAGDRARRGKKEEGGHRGLSLSA